MSSLVRSQLPPGFEAEFDAARSALGFYLQGAYVHESRRAEQGMRLSLQAVGTAPGNRFYLWGAGISDEHFARLAARGREDEARAAFASGGVAPR